VRGARDTLHGHPKLRAKPSSSETRRVELTVNATSDPPPSEVSSADWTAAAVAATTTALATKATGGEYSR
jgi:hypothetical protein